MAEKNKAIKVKLVRTDGWRERFTAACVKAAERRGR